MIQLTFDTKVRFSFQLIYICEIGFGKVHNFTNIIYPLPPSDLRIPLLPVKRKRH